MDTIVPKFQIYRSREGAWARTKVRFFAIREYSTHTVKCYTYFRPKVPSYEGTKFVRKYESTFVLPYFFSKIANYTTIVHVRVQYCTILI